MENVTKLLIERGKDALEISRRSVLEEKVDDPLQEPLRYFMEEVWCNFAHPALLSLTCEAVGGNPNATTHVGAAFVVLSGAADVHDDIIEQSMIKDSKPTIFGKYGKDVAIVIGDILFYKGVYMLHDACENFSKKQRVTILRLAKLAFFKIGSVEAEEARFRGRIDLRAEEYVSLIEKKVAIAEVAASIGAIIGDGTPQDVERMGHYGKTLGFLMTVRDEFIDLFELDELKNRLKNECLPLPLLYAIQDSTVKSKVLRILQSEEITQSKLDELLEIVANAGANRKLVVKMKLLIEDETRHLQQVRKNAEILKMLLNATLEDLPH